MPGEGWSPKGFLGIVVLGAGSGGGRGRVAAEAAVLDSVAVRVYVGHGSEPTSHGASPLLRVLRVPWRSKRPGASLRPGDGLTVRMRPEGAGMDLGGCSGEERLREESRWAGSGWQSRPLRAREHTETWQGWDDTQCGARQSGSP